MRGTGSTGSGGIAAVGVVLALTLPLVGCDSGDDVDGRGSPAAVTTSAPPPAPTVDPAVYRRTLAGALKPLDKALRAMNRAGGEGRALTKAFGTASDAAGTAADALTTAPTPDDAVTANVALTIALRALSEDLKEAGTARGRCATSPRVELASAEGPAGLRDASAALTGLGYPARVVLPRTEKPQKRRLGNGTLVKDAGRSGLGRLTIDNGTESDAVVSLTGQRRTAFTLYIRKGRSATVRAVEDGSYTVYFASGTDWNSAKKSFTRDCSFQKFDDKAAFRTVAVTGGTQYTVLTYSLAKSVGGNATTSEVPEDEFPS
ncbi:hypothetical protein [Streptomyces sp. NPDC088258]|uniref:hypothetical protein n=1 Tax=Streptomyces sp. NPDC088258 TaxID=3365849 RepID=UPI0038029DD3